MRKCEGTEKDSNRSSRSPANEGAQGCFSNTSVLQELTTAGYAISEELTLLPSVRCDSRCSARLLVWRAVHRSSNLRYAKRPHDVVFMSSSRQLLTPMSVNCCRTSVILSHYQTTPSHYLMSSTSALAKQLSCCPGNLPSMRYWNSLNAVTTLCPFVCNSLKAWTFCISTWLHTVTSNPGT